MPALDLALIWAGLIAFAVLAYVVLDGFDLGIGIIFPALRSEADRDLAMNSVAPVWDGNETWLILGGGGLFAVFPLAYAVVMPALYAPVTAMLLGLIFRGVAFEYRWRARRKYLWDAGFAGGSMVAAVAQGMILAALVQGIEVDARTYAGGHWDWLSAFSVLVGVALATGYALLGATWLVLKTTDTLQAQARILARHAAIATIVMLGAVCLATPFLHESYLERWFSGASVTFSVILPGLVVLAAWALFRSLAAGRDAAPFLAALALFGVSFTGIGVSVYPYVVPHAITIWEAAAPRTSLIFTLVGAGVLLPLILAYTAYAYWVFRGKTDRDAGYH